jgi:hypothetical protein
VGKLRWEGVVKDTTEAKQYERFFLCPSDIYRIRLAEWTLATMRTTLMMNSTVARNSSSIQPIDSSQHRLPATVDHHERTLTTMHR